MIEKEQSVILANKILENASLDPDGDLCVLARQLLRREERLQRISCICHAAEAAGVDDTDEYVHIGKIARGESLGLDLSPIKSRDFVSSEEL